MYNKIIMKAIIFLIGVFSYLKIDGKYKVTNKINSKLNINKEWKSSMLAIIVFISGLIILTTVRLLGYTTNTLTNLVTQELFLGITMCLSKRIISQFTLPNK